MNHVIYDVTQMVGSSNPLPLTWPCIDTGTLKIGPLRDTRISRATEDTDLVVQGWTFGHQVANEHKLKPVTGIATNSKEHFIVAEDGDMVKSSDKGYSVNVFDGDGNFMLSLFFVCGEECTNVSKIFDVATDKDDNVYVLAFCHERSDRFVACLYLTTTIARVTVFFSEISSKAGY